MFRHHLRTGVAHVAFALREPEAFAIGWRDGRHDDHPAVWLALAGTAIVGTTTYGATMGLLGGPGSMLLKALACTAAAQTRRPASRLPTPAA